MAYKKGDFNYIVVKKIQYEFNIAGCQCFLANNYA